MTDNNIVETETETEESSVFFLKLQSGEDIIGELIVSSFERPGHGSYQETAILNPVIVNSMIDPRDGRMKMVMVPFMDSMIIPEQAYILNMNSVVMHTNELSSEIIVLYNKFWESYEEQVKSMKIVDGTDIEGSSPVENGQENGDNVLKFEPPKKPTLH